MTQDQGILIYDDSWDYLIILDACRFDIFQKFSNKFFAGELLKAKSRGSMTLEWAVKTFTKKLKNVVYLSANPYINSIAPVAFFGGIAKWTPWLFFDKIIDLWAKLWNNYLNTVLPWRINEYTLHFAEHNKSKRLIVHYIQPHAPYLHPKLFGISFKKPSPKKRMFLHTTQMYRKDRINKHAVIKEFLNKFLGYLNGPPVFNVLYHLRFGNKLFCILRNILNLPYYGPIDYVVRKFGIKHLCKFYNLNVLIVLESVCDLVENIGDGKEIIITSDHGEFLGEKLSIGHPWGISDPILRNVPWFRVKKLKKRRKTMLPWIKKEIIKYTLRIKIKRRIKRQGKANR